MQLDEEAVLTRNALLPATATVVGIGVLAQIPSSNEVVGVGLVVAAVAIHCEAKLAR